MAITITHKKTANFPDWTQEDIDEQIALGNLPPGSTPEKLVLKTDWNEDHDFEGLLENPMTALGDIIYGGVAGAPTRLAGNTTTTRRFYTSLGTGAAAQAPQLFDLFNTSNIFTQNQIFKAPSSGLAFQALDSSNNYIAQAQDSARIFDVYNLRIGNTIIFNGGTANRFLKTDSGNQLEYYDLFGTNNTYTGSNEFSGNNNFNNTQSFNTNGLGEPAINIFSTGSSGAFSLNFITASVQVAYINDAGNAYFQQVFAPYITAGTNLSADHITPFMLGAVYIGGGLNPSADSSWSLGDASYNWSEVHAINAFFAGLSSVSGGDIGMNSSLDFFTNKSLNNVQNIYNLGTFNMPTGAVNTYVMTCDSSGNGTWQPSGGGGGGSQNLSQVLTVGNDATGQSMVNLANFKFAADNTYAIGGTTNRIADAYIITIRDDGGQPGLTISSGNRLLSNNTGNPSIDFQYGYLYSSSTGFPTIQYMDSQLDFNNGGSNAGVASWAAGDFSFFAGRTLAFAAGSGFSGEIAGNCILSGGGGFSAATGIQSYHKIVICARENGVGTLGQAGEITAIISPGSGVSFSSSNPFDDTQFYWYAVVIN